MTLFQINGRTLGDLTGRYTCHTPRGSSTVDYFIANRSLSHFIHSMKVHDLSILSDHCLISVNLKLHSQHSYVEERSSSEDNTPCFAPDRFVWSECSKSKYNEVFTSFIIQRKISYINAITESNITDVDILIDNISDVIVSAGDMTLLRKSVKAKKKRVHKVDKKWYDRDCHKVYKELKTMKNASMYSCSHSRIKCKNTMSDPIEITKGVHQGNVLSPLLFNVFINDIGDNFSVRDVPVLHNSNVSHLLYADDLLLLATDEHTLQQNIEKVHEFCNRWGLSVNADK